MSFQNSGVSGPDLIAMATYYQTHPVPQQFNAGIVIASVVASVLGAETTLLLLSRRTSTAGTRNWVLLLLAATSMGSVGIWGMHFIGMNISLHPAPGITWYIQFNPIFTVVSLFVPMISLVFAFILIGAGPESLPLDENEECPDKAIHPALNADATYIDRILWRLSDSMWSGKVGSKISLRIVVGGLLVGGTVALMHYSAGFSSSFHRDYSIHHLVFSIILACVASTLSLLVFFRFQAQWQDNWWRKLICASSLAAGVCGMHYLGLQGTRWYVPPGKTEGFSQRQHTSTVLTIAIGVMCFVVCVISFIIVLSDFLVTRESRRKARRVVIASATFDKAGRLLVNLDGMLPMSEVQTDLPFKDIIEELNYRQGTFQWLYSLSWSWSILEPFLPQIVARSLGLEPSNQIPLPSNTPRLFRGLKEPGSSYMSSKSAAQLALFKDRCIETTQSLANQLGLSMDFMGVFFDNVLRTGSRTTPTPNEKKSSPFPGDEESSMFSVSIPIPRQQGVMLFLVRELSGKQQDNAEHYLKRGYRFADPRWVSPVFADRVAVDKAEVDGLLDQLKLYAKRGTKPCVRSGGIYVGLFAVRPSISRQGGIDTLVYQFARHQIPAYRLPDVKRITDDMRAWVGTMAGRRMSELTRGCLSEAATSQSPPSGKFAEELWTFKSSLTLAVDAMTANLKMFPKLAERAVLSAEIIDMPSSEDDSTEPASMIVFQTTFPSPSRHGDELPGISVQNEFVGGYVKKDPAPTFVFVPYTLFSKTQMMMRKANGARKYARECRVELLKRYRLPSSVNGYAMSPALGTTALDYNPTVDDIAHPKHLSQTAANDPTAFLDDKELDEDGDLNEISVQVNTPQLRSPVRIVSQASGKSYEPPFYSPSTNRFSNPDDSLASTTLPSFPPSAKKPDPGGPLSPSWRSPEYKGVAAPAYFPIGIGITGTRTPGPQVSFQDSPGTQQTCESTPSQDMTDRQAQGYAHTSSTLSSPTTSPITAGHEGPREPAVTTPAIGRHRSVGELARTRAQPLAVTARLRSDDWPSRCLHVLEQSEAGELLLGVDW